MLVLLPIAFISGVLTVFSPCVLPILPIILASGIDGSKKRIQGVMAGLVLSFTIASLLLATVVTNLNIPADTVRNIAVGLLVVLSLSMIFPEIWNTVQTFIEHHWNIKPRDTNAPTFWSGFATGVSLGIVWTPCVGPIVATVATLAAVQSVSGATTLLVLSYSLGTALPLTFIAYGGAGVSSKLNFYKQNNTNIRQVFGFIILLTAFFIGTGLDRRFQTWTLENLPESWTNLAETFEQSFDIEEILDGIGSE